jgi:NitT/TauT family transport system substrate-binding protein
MPQPLMALETIPAAVIGVSVSIWPAIVAREKGFFKEEGLDIEMITAGSSARSLQQVAAGVANFGSSSMVDTVRAIDSGAELKAFTNSLAVGTHSLIAAKSIKSFAELKGKRVMTGGQGDITNLWWKAAAKQNGLDPNKDVELLFSGSTRTVCLRFSRAESRRPFCPPPRASRQLTRATPIWARSRRI